jgi:hypothetical protein
LSNHVAKVPYFRPWSFAKAALKFPQIDEHGLIGLTQQDTDHAKEKKE